jgi:hypothetical protein
MDANVNPAIPHEPPTTDTGSPKRVQAQSDATLPLARPTVLKPFAYFELICWAVFTFLQFRSYDGFLAPIAAISSPPFLFAAAGFVLALLALTLNGVTPVLQLAITTQHKLLESVKAPKAPEPASSTPTPDVIEQHFTTFIERSQETKDSASRRPNGLLFVGTVIALAGLGFYVLTLPKDTPGSDFRDTFEVYDRLIQLRLNLPAAAQELVTIPPLPPLTPQSKTWETRLWEVIPRLLMLIFIQVLAGFFLRQYRSSMEDFRYYESILRYRESLYLSYILRKQTGDKKEMGKFATEVLKQPNFAFASRSDANEFSSFYERLAAFAADMKRGAGTKKRQGAEQKGADARSHPGA